MLKSKLYFSSQLGTFTLEVIYKPHRIKYLHLKESLGQCVNSTVGCTTQTATENQPLPNLIEEQLHPPRHCGQLNDSREAKKKNFSEEKPSDR